VTLSMSVIAPTLDEVVGRGDIPRWARRRVL